MGAPALPFLNPKTVNRDFSFPLFSIFVLLHRDFPVLILQGSLFASFPVVTSSKSGHQGELSPPSPRHRFILTSDLHSCSDSRETEKILDPHRFNPFACRTLKDLVSVAAPANLPHFPHSCVLWRCPGAPHVYSHGEETLRIRTQAWAAWGWDTPRC